MQRVLLGISILCKVTLLLHHILNTGFKWGLYTTYQYEYVYMTLCLILLISYYDQYINSGGILEFPNPEAFPSQPNHLILELKVTGLYYPLCYHKRRPPPVVPGVPCALLFPHIPGDH